MKIKVILTGATGMVGEGVLNECLNHPQVEEVLSVSRRPCGISHPKLKELIHENFFDLSSVEDQLKGYNACFFCLGVSSIGMNERDYNHLTYELTMHFARTVVKLNPDMVFCYISGKGTDSAQKSNMMWARVKGKTENHIMSLPFKKSYMFRPGYLQPTRGMKHTQKYYKYVTWLFPLMLLVFPGSACSLKELGRAMINSILDGPMRSVLEVKRIVLLASQDR